MLEIAEQKRLIKLIPLNWRPPIGMNSGGREILNIMRSINDYEFNSCAAVDFGLGCRELDFVSQ